MYYTYYEHLKWTPMATGLRYLLQMVSKIKYVHSSNLVSMYVGTCIHMYNQGKYELYVKEALYI